MIFLTLFSLEISFAISLSKCDLSLIDSFTFFFPAGNYMFRVNNRNTRIKREICSKLTIKTPEWRQLHRFGVFIANFEHISHLVLLFLLFLFHALSREIQAGFFQKEHVCMLMPKEVKNTTQFLHTSLSTIAMSFLNTNNLADLQVLSGIEFFINTLPR